MGKNGSWWRRALFGVGVAGAALGLSSLALAYVSTHPLRRPVHRPSEWDGLPLEEVVFLSRDGLRISGWLLSSPGARAGMILCHGLPSNRMEMLAWARLLYPLGLHLLLFDFRALGRSEGRLCSIGHHEVDDLLGALDYFTARREMQGRPVGVFGLSMGGAVALMAAAQDARIAAVASHGTYARLDRAIVQRCRLYFGPLGPVVARPTTWWGRRWLPIDPRQVSPVDVIHRIAPRPVLLFHGGRDCIVRLDDARALYHAADPPKTLHLLPRSWHARIHPDERPGYEAALVRFFQTHLL